MAIDEIIIDPPASQWRRLLGHKITGELLGRSLAQWRSFTRNELDLPDDRPLVATGHQPTLWHPGILAKYMALSVFAKREGVSAANVVVDQDVADISGFDVPIRHHDGVLATRRIELRRPNPPADLPLGQQPAFEPLPLAQPLHAALDSVENGSRVIYESLAAHARAANAAEQVASSFDDLMQPWVLPMPRMMATTLMRTALAHALMQAMLDDPRRCAETYNRAVESDPHARLTPLLMRDDYVELPLWRLREDGRRIRAYDNDVVAAISSEPQSSIVNRQSSITTLLPRALFMTALIRLAVCDLFIHGLGGAVYDRAMERWIRDWLGVEVAPMAAVSATLRLPLMSDEDVEASRGDAIAQAQRAARRSWHDPESIDAPPGAPGPAKRELLQAIVQHPRNAVERRTAFFEMHERLKSMRDDRAGPVDAATREIGHLSQLARDARIALRRDWAFPLYPRAMLDELAARIARSAERDGAS